MAKKVNKKFLIGLAATAVVFGGGAGGLLWYHSRHHESPQTLFAEGDALMAKGQPDVAAGKFAEAMMISPNSPLAHARLGDALYQMATRDPEYTAKAMNEWNAALQIDPNFVPALSSVLDAYIADMEAYQKARNFTLVRDTATRLAKLDPSNTRAVSYQYIATLSAWMNNVETSPEDVKRSMDALRSLAQASPADASLPYQIARSMIQQGQNAARQGDMTASDSYSAAAAKVMDDAVASQPSNAMMLLRAGQINAILQIVYTHMPKEAAYHAQAAAYLDRARALVRPEDKSYEEVETVYGTFSLQQGDREEAQKTFREVMMHSPNDVPVRLMLAEILQADHSTRQEGADLLAQTVAEGEKPDAPRTAIARALQLRALLRLASVRMDLLEDVRDPAAYKTLLAQIDNDVAKAESRTAENPDTLKVRGRLDLIEGDVIDAVQTLTKATQLQPPGGQTDYELVYTLARAHLAAQQNEEAKRLLRQIVAKFPDYTPARSLLVTLLLNSNETAEAATNVDALEKQMPNSPVVARFRLLTLDPVKDKAEVDRVFASLPQDRRGDMLEKARIAITINKLDDAVRLMEAARGIDPSDVRVDDRLARLYLYKNDRARARTILNESLKIAPNDPQLLILSKRVDNATPNDLFDLVQSMIEGTPDPLNRALQLADLERLRGNGPELYKQLIAAEKIAPNDPRVQEQLFSYYLATQQYDAAAKYIPALTAANYGGSKGLIYRWKLAYTKGDYTGAIAIGHDFTQQMPEFAVSWITLGQAQKASGQFEDALQSFQTALDRQSANRDAIRGAIDCLYALNRYPEAKTLITSARKFYPTDLGLAEMEIEYELKYGDPANAMAPLLKTLHDDPNQVQNYLNVATMYYKMSTKQSTPQQSTDYLSKGISTLTDATAKFPDEMQPYVNLAELQGIGGDKAAAAATLLRMVNEPKLKDRPEPKLVLAEFYAKTDQPALAEPQYRAAVDVAPTSTELRRKLAVFLSQQGRIDEALGVIDAAPGKLSFDPVLVTARLEILTAAGRFADAEAACATALATKPDDPNWLAIQANAQYNQQKYDVAIATAQKAIDIDPKNNRALITRAMAKLNRPGADLTDATKDLIAYRDVNPTDDNVRRLLADADLRNQHPDDAIRELQAALQNNPGDRPVRQMLLGIFQTSAPPRWSDGDQTVKEADAIDSLGKDPQWLTTEANWLVLRKQYPAAVQKMQLAVAAAPKDANTLRQYLAVLLQTHNASALLEQTTPMIAADPNRWWIYHARALAEKQQGNNDAAAQDFNRAADLAIKQKDFDGVETVLNAIATGVSTDAAIAIVERHTGESVRYVLLDAALQLRKGNQEAGLQLIQSALGQIATASPDDKARIYSAAGAAYAMANPPESQQALDVYQKLSDLQPDNVVALNQCAWILVHDLNPSRPQDALAFSTRAYNIEQKANRYDANVFDTHGWVLIQCGQFDQGVAVLKQVNDSNPTIESLYHLAVGYLKQNKPDDALAQLQSAKDLIVTAEEKKITVDPALRSAIDAAMDQAHGKAQ